MPRINLLPWRQEQRKERQRQFMTLLGLSMAFTVLAILAIHLQISRMISSQDSRNLLLTSVIQDVEVKLVKIKDLEKEKQRLLDRMKIIQELQRNRPEVVRLFDELARTVPNGIYLREIRQQNKILELLGLAQSNARVSSFMRNLDTSKSMKNPYLNVIQSDKKQTISERNFSLRVVQISESTVSDDTKHNKKRKKRR